MEFFDVVKRRHSIRKFKPDDVPEEKLNLIFEAVNLAPSAGNLQAFEVFVVRDKIKLKQLSKAAFDQEFIAEAPIALVFCANPDRSAIKYGLRGRKLYCLLNYEHNVGNSISIRVGVGYFGASGEVTYKDTGKKEEIVANIGTFPIMANYFIGKGRHKIEIGGGMVLFTISAHGDEVSSNGIKFKAGLLPALTGTLGWRYQPREGGLVFKIAFTPIFNLDSFLPYGGIGVGYSF